MAGSNWMGGKRNAAKTRLQSTSASNAQKTKQHFARVNLIPSNRSEFPSNRRTDATYHPKRPLFEFAHAENTNSESKTPNKRENRADAASNARHPVKGNFEPSPDRMESFEAKRRRVLGTNNLAGLEPAKRRKVDRKYVPEHRTYSAPPIELETSTEHGISHFWRSSGRPVQDDMPLTPSSVYPTQLHFSSPAITPGTTSNDFRKLQCLTNNIGHPHIPQTPCNILPKSRGVDAYYEPMSPDTLTVNMHYEPGAGISVASVTSEPDNTSTSPCTPSTRSNRSPYPTKRNFVGPPLTGVADSESPIQVLQDPNTTYYPYSLDTPKPNHPSPSHETLHVTKEDPDFWKLLAAELGYNIPPSDEIVSDFPSHDVIECPALFDRAAADRRLHLIQRDSHKDSQLSSTFLDDNALNQHLRDAADESNLHIDERSDSESIPSRLLSTLKSSPLSSAPERVLKLTSNAKREVLKKAIDSYSPHTDVDCQQHANFSHLVRQNRLFLNNSPSNFVSPKGRVVSSADRLSKVLDDVARVPFEGGGQLWSVDRRARQDGRWHASPCRSMPKGDWGEELVTSPSPITSANGRKPSTVSPRSCNLNALLDGDFSELPRIEETPPTPNLKTNLLGEYLSPTTRTLGFHLPCQNGQDDQNPDEGSKYIQATRTHNIPGDCLKKELTYWTSKSKSSSTLREEGSCLIGPTLFADGLLSDD